MEFWSTVSSVTAYSIVASIAYVIVFAIAYYTALKITKHSGILLGIILSILPAFIGGAIFVYMARYVTKEFFGVKIFSTNLKLLNLLLQLLLMGIVCMIVGVYAGWKRKKSADENGIISTKVNQPSFSEGRRFKNYISAANIFIIIIIGVAIFSGNHDNNNDKLAPAAQPVPATPAQASAPPLTNKSNGIQSAPSPVTPPQEPPYPPVTGSYPSDNRGPLAPAPAPDPAPVSPPAWENYGVGSEAAGWGSKAPLLVPATRSPVMAPAPERPETDNEILARGGVPDSWQALANKPAPPPPPDQGQLQAEDRSRFVRSPSASKRVRPAPDATVVAVQRRLNQLGYHAGLADGILGGKTRAAIQAFQRDNAIAEDGVASASLLRHIEALEQPSGKYNMRPTFLTPADPRSSIPPAPPNAFTVGMEWYCNSGYKKVRNQCQSINAPPNSITNGPEWYCINGYKQIGNKCEYFYP